MCSWLIEIHWFFLVCSFHTYVFVLLYTHLCLQKFLEIDTHDTQKIILNMLQTGIWFQLWAIILWSFLSFVTMADRSRCDNITYHILNSRLICILCIIVYTPVLCKCNTLNLRKGFNQALLLVTILSKIIFKEWNFFCFLTLYSWSLFIYCFGAPNQRFLLSLEKCLQNTRKI